MAAPALATAAFREVGPAKRTVSGEPNRRAHHAQRDLRAT